MMKFVLPVILGGLGIGAGFGAAEALGALRAAMSNECTLASDVSDIVEVPPDISETKAIRGREYFKFSNQFIVPIVAQESVGSLAVLSISLEIPEGEKEAVFAIEPKIRNEVLAALFDYANDGGFDGVFTSRDSLTRLQEILQEAAHRAAGVLVSAVLITDVVRQDVPR